MIKTTNMKTNKAKYITDKASPANTPVNTPLIITSSMFLTSNISGGTIRQAKIGTISGINPNISFKITIIAVIIKPLTIVLTQVELLIFTHIQS